MLFRSAGTATANAMCRRRTRAMCPLRRGGLTISQSERRLPLTHSSESASTAQHTRPATGRLPPSITPWKGSRSLRPTEVAQGHGPVRVLPGRRLEAAAEAPRIHIREGAGTEWGKSVEPVQPGFQRFSLRRRERGGDLCLDHHRALRMFPRLSQPTPYPPLMQSVYPFGRCSSGPRPSALPHTTCSFGPLIVAIHFVSYGTSITQAA